MSQHSQILESLRKSGHRVTPQRVIILEAIQAHGGHISAEEVFQQVQAEHPYLNRSTVYRTLEMLTKEGIVTVTDLGKGRVHYELHRTEPHHHLVCQKCGKVEQLDHVLLEPLQTALLRQYKFKANIEHFAIFGLCNRCQAKSVKSRKARRA